MLLLFVFHFYLCNAVWSVPCGLVVSGCKRADLLLFLCIVFPCILVAFPSGVPDKVYLPSSQRCNETCFGVGCSCAYGFKIIVKVYNPEGVHIGHTV